MRGGPFVARRAVGGGLTQNHVSAPKTCAVRRVAADKLWRHSEETIGAAWDICAKRAAPRPPAVE